jgi:hypothetical protein
MTPQRFPFGKTADLATDVVRQVHCQYSDNATGLLSLDHSESQSPSTIVGYDQSFSDLFSRSICRFVRIEQPQRLHPVLLLHLRPHVGSLLPTDFKSLEIGIT